MRSAVLVFPGSTCEADCARAVRDEVGGEVDFVWHERTELDGFDLVVVPGGFSYGDYLRSGAIARFSPVVQALTRAAARGVTVLGICNGFQILLEAGLLPGAMRPNASLRFVCAPCRLRVEDAGTRFTRGFEAGEIVNMPIAHGEGNYYVDAETLARLEANGQVVFRYLDDPNGSVAGIAGLRNEEGNVLGMMPHPERATRDALGSRDGARLFRSLLDHVRGRHELAGHRG